MIEKVISGGQIGADQAGLAAAYHLKIPTGGWAPKGFQTSKGKASYLLEKRYGLKEVETPGAGGYIERSKRNVDESDGTIAFKVSSSVGTDKTIGYCKTRIWKVLVNESQPTEYKPILIFSLDESEEDNLSAFKTFILSNSIKTLNICGQRSGKTPDWPKQIKRFLIKALQTI